MKYFNSFFTLILFTQILIAQESDCFENLTGSYWPIKVGLERNYISGNNTYSSLFNGDSIKYNGKYYLVETKKYSNGKTKISYWRRDSKGNILNYNKEKSIVSMELPSNSKIGQKWKSTDKTWTYKIISLSSNYSTPFCEFSNLLEVETTSSERKGMIYNLFYMKGKGMIGLNVNGKPYTYIKPNRKLNEKSFMAFGCQNYETVQEIQTCTSAKISEYIKNNFRPTTKIKKGKIIVRIVIQTDGVVQEAIIIKGIKKAKKQENELIRVIKSLPKFIPAQIDENQPIKTSFIIPVQF